MSNKVLRSLTAAALCTALAAASPALARGGGGGGGGGMGGGGGHAGGMSMGGGMGSRRARRGHGMAGGMRGGGGMGAGPQFSGSRFAAAPFRTQNPMTGTRIGMPDRRGREAAAAKLRACAHAASASHAASHAHAPGVPAGSHAATHAHAPGMSATTTHATSTAAAPAASERWRRSSKRGAKRGRRQAPKDLVAHPKSPWLKRSDAWRRTKENNQQSQTISGDDELQMRQFLTPKLILPDEGCAWRRARAETESASMPARAGSLRSCAHCEIVEADQGVLPVGQITSDFRN